MSDDEPDLPPDAAEPKGSRGVLVVWFLVLLGLPLIVLGQLIRRDHPIVPLTQQPGGEIRGVVNGPDGAPRPGDVVELWLVAMDLTRTRILVAETDAAGRFTFAAPPVEGRYEVRAGGGLLRRVVAEHSLTGTAGERDLVIDLEPGAVLDVELRRADGRAVGDGEALLVGKAESAPLFGLFNPELRVPTEFTRGRLRLDGLPPLTGRLQVQLAAGDSASRDVRLVAGENRIEWVLD